MRIISLGWGVQSFTLAAMVALGELEPVDAAIHADTTHESQLTYWFAMRWERWLEERGVRVVTVKDENAADRVWSGEMIPAFTLNEHGNTGQALRTCTQRWKVAPMRRWISGELERRGEAKTPGAVEQWLGISLDEYQRMKPSDVKYITNLWPLIEKHMTRNDCINWLKARGLEVPPKSACYFCPYHSTEEWRRIKNNDMDWAGALEVDRVIRKVRPPFDLFLHPTREPLAEVDFRTAEEKGQLSLWDQECEGICGI